MKNIVFNQRVSFRDAEMNRVNVEIKISSVDKVRRRRSDLSTFQEKYEVSITGDMCSCGGQILGCIKPRTTGQKKFVDLWNSYHLNGEKGGTNKQLKYLNSEKYEQDYCRFLEIFSHIPNEDRIKFDDILCTLLNENFSVGIREAKQVSMIMPYLRYNPVSYIMGAHESDIKHGKNDYNTKCFFLSLNGIYKDRGYIYGTDWLYRPIPDNIVSVVKNLCDKIEKEEQRLTQELSKKFGVPNRFMSEDDRPCDVLSYVQNESEAYAFIALGLHLGCTYVDVYNSFRTLANNLYRVDGIEYYVGTYKELYELAEAQVHHDELYKEQWRDAVSSHEYEGSLQEFLNELVESEWEYILSPNGEYNHYNIEYKDIYVMQAN